MVILSQVVRRPYFENRRLSPNCSGSVRDGESDVPGCSSIPFRSNARVRCRRWRHEPVWSRDGRPPFHAQQRFRNQRATTPTFAVTSRDILFGDTFVRAPAPKQTRWTRTPATAGLEAVKIPNLVVTTGRECANDKQPVHSSG